MKKMIVVSLAALLGSCAVDDKYYGKEVKDFEAPYKIDWVAAADSSTRMVMIDKHWMRDTDELPINDTYWYFNPSSDKKSNLNNGYWPQAHCIDVITDAYLRTGDPEYKEIMEQWFIGIPKYQYARTWNPRPYYNGEGPGNNGWFNHYIDDMEWIVLSQIRMYEAFGGTGNVDSEDPELRKYLDVAREIYDNWIITTWDDDGGGGVLWTFDSSQPKSKNACSNGPAAIIAARLYQITGEEHYLEEAIMIYEWEKAMLYIPETGAVWDHYSCVTGTVGGDFWTYNTGTFLGAGHLLYDITGKESYLREAIKAAEFTITDLTDASGKLLKGAWTNDLALFKGIFVRYFTLLTNDTRVDKATRQKFHDFLTYNATILWTEGIIKNDPDGYGMLYSGNLDVPGYFIQQFGYNCSGCVIIEAMNILQPVL